MIIGLPPQRERLSIGLTFARSDYSAVNPRGLLKEGEALQVYTPGNVRRAGSLSIFLNPPVRFPSRFQGIIQVYPKASNVTFLQPLQGIWADRLYTNTFARTLPSKEYLQNYGENIQ